MAPRTVGGLAIGMAHGGHIHSENYEFTSIKGPTPMSSYGHGPNLRHGDLGYVSRHRHTLRTAPGGCILEFTYMGGPTPSLATDRSQDFHPESQRHVAQRALPRNGPRWPHPFRESRDRLNQWINTRHRLLAILDSSCGRTVSQNHPIYKSTSIIAITKAIKPSYLSPYKPGSLTKS